MCGADIWVFLWIFWVFVVRSDWIRAEEIEKRLLGLRFFFTSGLRGFAAEDVPKSSLNAELHDPKTCHRTKFSS